MKTAKRTKKKVAKAPAPAKEFNVNVDYVEQIADESVATTMAMRGLIRMQSIEITELRALVAKLRAKLEARK